MLRSNSPIEPSARESLRANANTVGEVIRSHADLRPEQTAMVASGFAPLSYRELWRHIEGVRTALRLLGFGPTARIAVLMPAGPNAALAIVAIACSAVSIPLDPRQGVGEIEYSLDVLSPDAVIVFKGFEVAARSVATHLRIPIIEITPLRATLGFRILPPEVITPTSKDDEEPVPDAPAFILQTSGTSGGPKLIPISHRIMLAVGKREQISYELTHRDRCLSVTPIWYAYGLLLPILTPLLTGGTVAFPRNPMDVNLSEWLSELGPTWLSAGPTLHLAILDHLKAAGGRTEMHSLRFILTSGAPLSEALKGELQAQLGVPVLDRYGSTETQLISTNRPIPGLSKPGTCGVPWPGTVSIIDENGNRLANGELGEVLVSGDTVIPGYLNAPELTRERFVNGSFKTGDVGSLDTDGFLTLRGRKSELINRGGEKIAPSDVESALLCHPAVREAAAYGVPHPRLGENVAVAVVLQQGASATVEELHNFARVKLPRFKVPQRIEIFDALPKGNAGKVLRTHLTEAYISRGRDIDSPRTPLEVQILEIWQRLLHTTDLGTNDDFFEAGGDSLLATEMLFEVEAILGRRIPQSLLVQALTIRHLASIATPDKSREDEVVIKAKDGTGIPFFFCHGDFSTRGFYAQSLASKMGLEQPVYLIQPLCDVEVVSRISMEEMALRYLPRLQAIQPSGSFQLGGYCNGGLLAWEIARQLIRAGRKVDFVMMVDSYSLNARRPFRIFQWLLYRVGNIMVVHTRTPVSLPIMQTLWNFVRRWDRGEYNSILQVLNSMAQRFRKSGGRVSSAEPELLDVQYFRLMAHYVPPKLGCNIIAIIAENNVDSFGRSVLPWAKLGRKVLHGVVSGNHLTVITTHVDSLAKAMGELMGRALRKQ